MKGKLLTKFDVDNKQNLKLLKKEVEKLKKEFNKRRYNHIGELYEILNKIVKFRSEENSRYTPRSLEHEDGLNLKPMEIRYIFSYQYISSYGRQKVKEGLISDATICHFLAVHSLLREHQWQNTLIDKVILEELKISAISELTKDELKLFLLGKLKLRTDDKYFLTLTKSLRSAMTRIEQRKHLLNKSPYGDNLISAVEKLNNLIQKNKKK